MDGQFDASDTSNTIEPKASTTNKNLVLFPFQLDGDAGSTFRCKSSFFRWMPWRATSVIGLTGSWSSAPDRRVDAIAFESPDQIMTPVSASNSVSKQELERTHLDRYVTDFALSTGSLPYLEVTPAPQDMDPPDFNVVTPEGELGLDCLQLTVPSRRQINGAFRVVRDAILREPREKFAHLIGHVVYMWFRDSQDNLLFPPQRTQHDEMRSLIDALVAHRIAPEEVIHVPMTSSGVPESLLGVNLGWDTSLPKTRFYATSMYGAVPGSMFFNRTGFEIGMAATTIVDITEHWMNLIDAIRAKDKPGTDHVLITAGGPDRFGFVFPSETYLAESMLSIVEPQTGFRHLSRITMHLWQTGQIVDIYPELQIGSALYPGRLSPPYFSARDSSVHFTTSVPS